MQIWKKGSPFFERLKSFARFSNSCPKRQTSGSEINSEMVISYLAAWALHYFYFYAEKKNSVFGALSGSGNIL